MEAIILAGGLGTRLQSIVNDLPKCMADVAGKPFLFYVIQHLRMQNVQRIIFSLGYKHESITNYLAENFSTLNYDVCVEKEQLGTGGAIQLALEKTKENDVIVVNGDTLFKSDLQELYQFHLMKKSACTLALKQMYDFDRYGVVELDNNSCILSFTEKKYFQTGLINVGVYIINKYGFLNNNLPIKFSFEKDYLEKFVSNKAFYATIQNNYFIDIGIPEDYYRAQTELKQSTLDYTLIDKTWTLFLDRDGVINKDKDGSYIFNYAEFEFLEGVLNAIQKCSNIFGRIIIVTNQRGIGKQLMSINDLDAIHQNMKNEIEAANGKIDAIYYAPNIDSKDFHRKPNPGMALLAKHDFQEIDLNKSIMVGNNYSDMQFAKNAGMYSIFVKTTIKNPKPEWNIDIDKTYDSLQAFTNDLF
ncbi:MAG: HAD-IIIA family hydrolase [Sphingobacteriales bacterium]|jgi:D-glycero-alpha-D-manno-heptose 1-phosphate guanylyltransferase|nr:MAG: HAD-IIIA family hydrolase [Sphingobacteriales bacterium]